MSYDSWITSGYGNPANSGVFPILIKGRTRSYNDLPGHECWEFRVQYGNPKAVIWSCKYCKQLVKNKIKPDKPCQCVSFSKKTKQKRKLTL